MPRPLTPPAPHLRPLASPAHLPTRPLLVPLLLSLVLAACALAGPQPLLLDAALSAPHVVAVGERGSILLSSDNARTWRPVTAPVRATLTAVSFATLSAPRLGWAVGHDAVILATTDAGATWVKQFQGDNLEDSFLDVLALDAQRVIAIGAYGLCVTTNNGGRTWTRRQLTEDDPHLNRIVRASASTLIIAGERGTLLRSTDLGATWRRLTAPYEGSFHGLLSLDRRSLLVCGLRGHAFISNDEGDTWRPASTPQPALLAAAIRLRDNSLLLAGQARALLLSRDSGLSFHALPGSLPSGVAKLLELPDGTLLALGEAGATRLDPGQLAVPAKP